MGTTIETSGPLRGRAASAASSSSPIAATPSVDWSTLGPPAPNAVSAASKMLRVDQGAYSCNELSHSCAPLVVAAS
ncbi:MAG: hypothetical protein ABSB70_24990, partial [Candidatus Velthaea sp.]